MPDDPRVRRQGDLFHAAGWQVHAFGTGTARSELPTWNVWPGNWSPPEADPAAIPGAPKVGPDPIERVLVALARSLSLLNPLMQKQLDPVKYWRWALFQQELPKAWRARRSPQDAVDAYLENNSVWQLYAAAASIKADIYLANDWHALPVALRLAREYGGFVCYDTHEYAIEEYKQYLDWRFTRIAIAKAIEGVGLREAIVASTVSQGIADDLCRIYLLDKPILEIRNVPYEAPADFRPCASNRIRVLYHGLIVGDRGLEDCVRSVRHWRDDFVFVLRGPVADAFKAKLTTLARENGVENRIFFLPPVPMTDLVRHAREDGDIGLFTPLQLSRHYKFVLPNKLFEYIQAGLAICVANLPDMARIVTNYNLGHLVDRVEPKMIAETINRFTSEDVDRYKRHSIAASSQLCWEVESRKMLAAYDEALTKRGR